MYQKKSKKTVSVAKDKSSCSTHNIRLIFQFRTNFEPQVVYVL